MYFIIFFTFLCSTIYTWIIDVYFIIFLHFHFVLQDYENYLDLINIEKDVINGNNK